jgi:hypothetical protein
MAYTVRKQGYEEENIMHPVACYGSASFPEAQGNQSWTHLSLVYGERLLLQYEPFSEKDETCKPLFLHANHPGSYDMRIEYCLRVAIGRSAYPSVIS